MNAGLIPLLLPSSAPPGAPVSYMNRRQPSAESSRMSKDSTVPEEVLSCNATACRPINHDSHLPKLPTP